MKENHLQNGRDLQVKMTNDICCFIETELGKKMIGWNEILGINAHGWSKETAQSTQMLSKKAVIHVFAARQESKICHFNKRRNGAKTKGGEKPDGSNHFCWRCCFD